MAACTSCVLSFWREKSATLVEYRMKYTICGTEPEVVDNVDVKVTQESSRSHIYTRHNFQLGGLTFSDAKLPSTPLLL